MSIRLERLNTISPSMYVIPSLVDNANRLKCRRIEESKLIFVFDNIDVNVGGVDEGLVEPSHIDALPNPTACSHVSKFAPILLASKLIYKEAIDWYSHAEEKLGKELANIALGDHSWSLKSWDENGARVVKFNC